MLSSFSALEKEIAKTERTPSFPQLKLIYKDQFNLFVKDNKEEKSIRQCLEFCEMCQEMKILEEHLPIISYLQPDITNSAKMQLNKLVVLMYSIEEKDRSFTELYVIFDEKYGHHISGFLENKSLTFSNSLLSLSFSICFIVPQTLFYSS